MAVHAPLWFSALAVSALLLGAGKQIDAVTEVGGPPALVLTRGPEVRASGRRLDATATERALTPACVAAPDIRPLAISPDDLEVLARVVNGECPSDTPFEGKVAVAAVVLNRVRSKRFPTSIPLVAHQERQFSCYNPSNRARLYGAPIPPAAWEAARAAVDGLDPTGGCTHFFNPHLVEPGWARELEFVKRIGTAPRNTHAFYRERGVAAGRATQLPKRR